MLLLQNVLTAFHLTSNIIQPDRPFPTFSVQLKASNKPSGKAVREHLGGVYCPHWPIPSSHATHREDLWEGMRKLHINLQDSISMSVYVSTQLIDKLSLRVLFSSYMNMRRYNLLVPVCSFGGGSFPNGQLSSSSSFFSCPCKHRSFWRHAWSSARCSPGAGWIVSVHQTPAQTYEGCTLQVVWGVFIKNFDLLLNAMVSTASALADWGIL